MRSFVIVLTMCMSTLLMWNHAFAQIRKPSLDTLEKGCKRTVKTQTQFDTDRVFRADYITLCESKSNELIVWFESAHLVKRRHHGHPGPWMRIQFENEAGEIIFENLHAWRVRNLHCGGYAFHFHKVATVLNEEVHGFKAGMGTGLGGKCKTGGAWRDPVPEATKVIKDFNDCTKGKLSDTERDVCAYLKKNGVVSAPQ